MSIIIKKGCNKPQIWNITELVNIEQLTKDYESCEENLMNQLDVEENGKPSLIENMADKKKFKGDKKQVEKVEPLVLLIDLLDNRNVKVVNHFSHILR